MKEDSGGATLRYTVLGHVVRGGRPSSLDRIMASRLGYTAVHAAIEGKTRVMLGWRPDDDGGTPSPVDPRVELFDLDHVITQTQKLLEGSHR